MNVNPRSRWRSILRWCLPVMFGLLLTLLWVLSFSGGMRAVWAWLLLDIAGFVGVLLLLLLAIYAIWKRRFSMPMWVTLGVALFSLWPLAWSFGVLPVAFPASLEKTAPSISVRLPINEPLRVGWGGDRVEVNYHAAHPDQRWAYDLFVEPVGHASTKLEDYGCYGKTVVAPVTGRVHHAIDGQPDQAAGMYTPNREHPLGNAVVLSLETGTYLVIGHLKPGSVRVRAGDQVREGEPIGSCGNTGNTSEPHIHIHHQRQDPKKYPTGIAEGLPLYFRDHDGPAMPEGGVGERDGKPAYVGAIVKHMGRTGDADRSSPSSSSQEPIE